MDQEQRKMIIGLLGIVYLRTLLQNWLKEMKGNTVMIDEEKASILFPWLLSGVFDDDLIFEVLGISSELNSEIRLNYIN